MSFSRAIKFTLQWEGGYVNHPSDPGGETNYGISKKAYPDVDIKALTKQHAENIYYQDYWLKCGCQDMEEKLGISVFDAAVNCGVSRAKRWCVVGTSADSFNEQRQQYYDKLKSKFPMFYKGWMNRLNALKDYINES